MDPQAQVVALMREHRPELSAEFSRLDRLAPHLKSPVLNALSLRPQLSLADMHDLVARAAALDERVAGSCVEYHPRNPIALYTRGWARFAQFSGRATRREYWWFSGINLLVLAALFGSAMALGSQNRVDPALLVAVASAFTLISLIPWSSVGARRLHDTNKSGWWQLCQAIPYVGGLVVLALMSRKSDSHTNRFGPPQARRSTQS